MKKECNFTYKFLVILIVLNFSNLYHTSSQTIIKMKLEGGVYHIPCVVNGLLLSFIFDTGASDVLFSLKTAKFMLENGYLDEKNILGSSYYQIANGSYVNNTQIIIKEIVIGGVKINDVKAAISNELNAPLLLGQTAIKKLGSIKLDGEYLTIESGIADLNNTNKVIKAFDNFLKAYEANNNGLFYNAINYINAYIDYNPKDIHAYLLLADIYNNNNNYSESIKCLEKVLLIEPDREGIFHVIALQYSKLNNHYEAIRYYQKAIDLEPNDYLSYYNMARIYSILKEYDKAIFFNKKVIEIQPDYAYAYNNIADSYNQIGKYSEALKYAQKAIDLDSKMAEAYLSLAFAYRGLRDVDKTIYNLKIAARYGNSLAQMFLNKQGIKW